MELGDSVEIRLDVEVTTGGANHVIDIDLQLGIGGTPFQIPFISGQNIKTASTFRATRWQSIYISNANTRDNPAKFRIASDSTGDTVVVNGWYVRLLTKAFKDLRWLK